MGREWMCMCEFKESGQGRTAPATLPGPLAVLGCARTCSSCCPYPAYMLKLLMYILCLPGGFPRTLHSSYRNPILPLACLKQDVPLAEVFHRDLAHISGVDPLKPGHSEQ